MEIKLTPSDLNETGVMLSPSQVRIQHFRYPLSSFQLADRIIYEHNEEEAYLLKAQKAELGLITDPPIDINDIPDYLLEKIEGRLTPMSGPELTFEELEEHINNMTREELVVACVGWELGDGHWANLIARWMVELGAKPENF